MSPSLCLRWGPEWGWGRRGPGPPLRPAWGQGQRPRRTARPETGEGQAFGALLLGSPGGTDSWGFGCPQPCSVRFSFTTPDDILVRWPLRSFLLADEGAVSAHGHLVSLRSWAAVGMGQAVRARSGQGGRGVPRAAADLGGSGWSPKAGARAGEAGQVEVPGTPVCQLWGWPR